MREKRIQVKPFEMLSILDYVGRQMVNEHGSVMVIGIIASEKKDEYIKKAASETWVQVVAFDEMDEETTLFCGILTNFKVTEEGSGCMMELCLCTGTKLMDYEKHTRSYQKDSYTYDQIVKERNSDYEDADTIFTKGKGNAISGFMLQYEETDWTFLKRLASTLNTVLVPDCGDQGERYYFGVPNKQADCEPEVEGYTTIQDYVLSENGKAEMKLCYIIESRMILSLGSCTVFKGNQFSVWKIESRWKGDELLHQYHLKPQADFWTARQYHEAIIGLSLMGTVKAVKGEQVQIQITKDENKESGQRWFDFSTVYSSPEGAGWYCMPEAGDTIRLYCPSEDESEAYVISAVHENTGNGIRTNPKHKIWRNPQGKEIRMTPENILLTNNDGMSVELSDGAGIKIKSNASISIQASDHISLNSNASLEMVAANKIVLKQGDTTMELADGIKLSGAKINLQ